MKKLGLVILLASSVAFGAPAQHEAAVSTAHTEQAAAEEQPPGPLTFWDTKIVQNEHPPLWAYLFNFALLVFIYYRFGKKPTVEALKTRKLSIASAIEGAQRILREAKARAKRYRAKLEKVSADAEEGKKALVSTGKGEAETILRTAAEKAERIQRDATFLVEQEKKQTKLDLVRETVEKATHEAEELLRKSVTPADQERLAEDFVAKLAKDYEKGLNVS
jgi:F-type H+-transporting ATPase subunit b